MVITERPEAAKRADVPNYVTATGYVEDIAAREMVGDTQDKRLLAVMNLETGKTVNVPLFIQEGETVKIDTRTGAYMGRA